MKRSLFLGLAACALTLTGSAAEEEKKEAPPVPVHIEGKVKKPGYIPLPARCTLADLKNACGGLTEFGSERRIGVIRFSFPGGVIDPSKIQVQETISLAQLKNEDATYTFKAGDFIYVPAKQLMAR